MPSLVIIYMLKYMVQENHAFWYACISDSSSSNLTAEEVYRSEATATLDNFKFSGKAQLYIMYELLEECDQ